MTFKPYPKYKASGVEWLGAVPAHWEAIALKRDMEFVTSGSRGWAEHYADQGHVFLRIGNLTRDRIDLDLSDIQYVEVPEGSEGERTRVRANDLLVSITAYLGSVAVIPEGLPESYVSQHVALARPLRITLSPRWCAYAILSDIGKTHFERQGYGGTKVQLSLEDVRTMPIPAPPIDEQIEIVTYLDGAIAKIDTLIAKQEAMISLLKEKRQAVISHAVTKGLDPTVPMKDSGVEWLGDVPEHWQVKRVKFVSSDTKAGPFGSALTKDMYCSEGYRVYGQEQVIPNDFSIGDYFINDEQFESLKQYEVLPGDILISCVGTFGKIAVAPESLVRGIINPRLIRLRSNKYTSSDFLAILLRSSVGFEQFSQLSRGGTMDVINIGVLSELRVTLPPLAEQNAIVANLTKNTARIDALIAKAQQAIALQKEHRTALISAAVTGKIDVRGEVTERKAA